MSVDSGRPRARQLRIGEAARALGVSATVVQALADHGLLSVEWSPGGHRRFWAWEVQALARLRAMVGQRTEPAVVAAAVELPASPMPPALLASEDSGGVLVGRVR